MACSKDVSSLPELFIMEMDKLEQWLEDNKGDAGLVKWKDLFFKLAEKHHLVYFMKIPPMQARQYCTVYRSKGA